VTIIIARIIAIVRTSTLTTTRPALSVTIPWLTVSVRSLFMDLQQRPTKHKSNLKLSRGKKIGRTSRRKAAKTPRLSHRVSSRAAIRGNSMSTIEFTTLTVCTTQVILTRMLQSGALTTLIRIMKVNFDTRESEKHRM
jgi:hypothetical protein